MKHVNGEYIVDRCITVRFQPVDSSVLLNIFLYIYVTAQSMQFDWSIHLHKDYMTHLIRHELNY